MLDKALSWLVLVIPVALGVAMIFVPSKTENEESHKRWRMLLGASLILYAGMTGWQQSRAVSAAAREKDDAINKTSDRVAQQTTTNVTQALEKQYRGTIREMASQLAQQGNQMNTIGSSNIVTGKKPIAVIVTNPSSGTPGELPLDLHVARIPQTPDPKYGSGAVQFIFTTNKVMNGGKVKVQSSKGTIRQGSAQIPGQAMLTGGGGVLDEHTYVSGIGSPNWSPDSPLLINLYYDGDDLGNCTFTPLK